LEDYQQFSERDLKDLQTFETKGEKPEMSEIDSVGHTEAMKLQVSKI